MGLRGGGRRCTGHRRAVPSARHHTPGSKQTWGSFVVGSWLDDADDSLGLRVCYSTVHHVPRDADDDEEEEEGESTLVEVEYR